MQKSINCHVAWGRRTSRISRLCAILDLRQEEDPLFLEEGDLVVAQQQDLVVAQQQDLVAAQLGWI